MASEEVYKSTRRAWIKLWVHEWLDGTTRFELDEKERGVWVDLMALAGDSKFPGIIASGQLNGVLRGYPLSYLSGKLVISMETLKSTLQKCEQYGKIKVEKNSEEYVIRITNFAKYQSEYLRQKEYYVGQQSQSKKAKAKELTPEELKKGPWYKEFLKKYPFFNEQELFHAIAWLKDHPGRKLSKAYLVNWAKNQEKEPYGKTNPSPKQGFQKL